MINAYLTLTKLDIDENLIQTELEQLEQFMVNSTLPPIRWEYQIPELGEGGACSLFGYLQDEPFKLTDYLPQNLLTAKKLAQLQLVVSYVIEKTQVDWFGIYQNTLTPQGKQLLKLAYVGAPSRPLFPLTEAFAKGSNNVQVALSGQGRVINNVEEYIAAGGEYYTCDPKVKSEACLALFDAHQHCVGIVDAEAFKNDFFTAQTQALLIACCIKIPHFLV